MTHWPMSTLGSCSELVDYGVTASAAAEQIGPKFLRITDIQNGRVNWEEVPYCQCRPTEVESSRLSSGDIVFARTGATTGKSFLIDECPNNTVFASYLIRVRLLKQLDPRFVSHYFDTPAYWRQISQSVRGVAQPGINATTLKSLKIPVPSIPVQRRIADILDRAEALRAKRRAALAQLDKLTQSVFLEMFGDPLQNSSRWQQSKIEEICNLVRGSSPRPQGDPRYFGGPVPRLMIADITRDGWLVTPRIDSLTQEGAKRSRPVEAGTIVMAVSGNVGLAAQLAINACIHDGFIAFTKLVSVVDPTYLLSTLRLSKSAHEKSKAGAIFINITTNDIKNLSISLPPFPIQQEFARRVQAIDRLKAKHRQSLAEMDALFQSLQHRVFRGEL